MNAIIQFLGILALVFITAVCAESWGQARAAHQCVEIIVGETP